MNIRSAFSLYFSRFWTAAENHSLTAESRLEADSTEGAASSVTLQSTRFGSKLLYWASLLLVVLLAAELASRLDDWLFNDVPLLANPDRDRDLLQSEPWGFRGKPNGAYRKWRLNSHGFLGPELERAPAGLRIMVLGASETFGLYESTGNDYPANLARELKRHGGTSVEIINASIAGITLPALTTYWQEWAARFNPHLVLIYPSTQFYLDHEIPRPRPPGARVTASPEPPLRSRFAERIKDNAKQLAVLRAIRARLVVGQALKGKASEYLITEVPPPERIAAFTTHLEGLADAIVARGALPVLVTHAFKAPLKLEPKDREELEYFRIFFPRATAEAFPAFAAAAREATLHLARRRGWAVIDVAGRLSGRRELFADPVHFNDTGSKAMAQLIAEALKGIVPQLATGGRP